MDEPQADRMNLEKLAKGPFGVHHGGEAKFMVRNTPSQDGIQAWHRLHRHYKRRTFARVLRVHKEVMHPKRVRTSAC